MKIVFTSLPAFGHLYPLLPLAQACVADGHDVVVATGSPFVGALPVPTTWSVGESVGLDDFAQETFRNHPDLAPGLEFSRFMFGESAPRYVRPVLGELFDREPPDLLVHEVMDIGAAVVAAERGIRAISYGIGLWNAPLLDCYGIAGADPAMPGGYLDPMPAALQNPGPLPASRRSVRPVPWAPEMPLPSWLPTGRPIVYVTLGTVFGSAEVLRRAVLETAAHDVDVLVAVGSAGDPAVLGELPDNVRLEKFVPQAEVLAHVDLVVHHGGAGTMLGTVAAGLPQLVLPQGADQPFNAAAVQRSGAGLALHKEEQLPGAIESAVATLLGDGPHRETATRIAKDIAAMPSPAEIAATL